MVRARRRCINLFKSFSTAIEHYTQCVTTPEKPRLAREERPTPNLPQGVDPPSKVAHRGGRGPRLGGPKVVTFGIRAVRSAQRLLTHTPALPTSPTAPPPSILSSSPPGTASSSFTSSWKAAMGMERLDWSHRDGPQSEALRTAIGLCSGFPQCSHLSHDDTRLAHAQQALNARRYPI